MGQAYHRGNPGHLPHSRLVRNSRSYDGNDPTLRTALTFVQLTWVSAISFGAGLGTVPEHITFTVLVPTRSRGGSDPRTTRRYDRARHNLDSHPTYVLSGLLK